MPVRSPHEGPALTMEILRAMPEEELALSMRIMLDWLLGRARQQVGPEPVPPVVAQVARRVLATLLLNDAICPRCAIGLALPPARDFLASCVLAAMMEGAEALRWHQLAQERPETEEVDPDADQGNQ